MIDNASTEVNTLSLAPEPVEVIASEDGTSPLALVLPPYDDIAEVEALSKGHFSVREWSAVAQASILNALASEKERLQAKYSTYKGSSTYLNRLANLAAIVGEREEEERYLRAAGELGPDEFFKNRLVENLLGRNKSEEAVDLLGRADFTKNLYANLRLASVFARNDRIPEATELVAQALRIDPLDFGARMFDGALKIWFGDYRGALLSFRVADESRPNSSALHTNMAVAYVRLRRDDKALKSLKLSVAIDPLNVNAVTLLADVADRLKCNEDAIPSLRYFLRFEQKAPAVWGRLARALYRIGEPKEALAALKRQASLDDQSLVWNNIGVAYHRIGDDTKALEAYKHSMLKCESKATYEFCLAARNTAALFSGRNEALDVIRFVDSVVDESNLALFAAKADIGAIFVIKLHSLVKARRLADAASFGEGILKWRVKSAALECRVATSLLSLYSLNEGGAERALALADEYAGKVSSGLSLDADIRRQLVNNLAFVFFEYGQLEKGERMLADISSEVHKRPYPTATLGLLHFRRGHVDRAEHLYLEAQQLCTRTSDRARIRQKWNLELGKLLATAEPKRAARHLAKAAEEKDAELGLALEASRVLQSLSKKQ